ncbi:methylenetetrahydrofolate--tRNA-(uracil(54)-C(5))-methyltransferase (FADH(2)-oxidizing) TrmFO [candidate division WOR-3 bacterium]|nr:methylenetetrahydrofolate--tRNA-(uracil(54)-C(5))-methyltransferase (FADH(2)-oxidizing) TrmFO [candidate division WOR-3 bacterium]
MNAATIVGAGLAGCEAALQCARRGVPVRLVEMRPGTMTEAHRTGDVAELVCSNSLKSDSPENAHGLLKAELRTYGSALLACADRARIPGGKALVVDRRRFSTEVQAALDAAGVDVVAEELKEVPAGVAVIATGPLTSQPMADALTGLLGAERLFFHDAVAPIVAAESLDMDRVFAGSRYDAGSDYLNCPLSEPEYDRLVEELTRAEVHPLHDFEVVGEIPGDGPQRGSPRIPSPFFEGCLPVEEMARRGRMVLAFGPLKPVGLARAAGDALFAVVQLRREDAAGTMYNLVGFQTRLRQAEQERVFRQIPGLERAEFLRFGSIHRNTYLDGPKVLEPTMRARVRPDLLVAGQLTGVEGYVESIAAGLVAGVNAARLARGLEPLAWPAETMVGSLLRYVSGAGLGHSPASRFQPMNANFGLLLPVEGRVRGRDRRRLMAECALDAARRFALTLGMTTAA